jgi:hypothetical protein
MRKPKTNSLNIPMPDGAAVPGYSLTLPAKPTEVMGLKPGGVYVLKLPEHCPQDGAIQISEYLKQWGEPLGIKFLVIGYGIEFAEPSEFLSSPQFKAAVKGILSE